MRDEVFIAAVIAGLAAAGAWLCCRIRRERKRREDEMKKLYGEDFGRWWNRR